MSAGAVERLRAMVVGVSIASRMAQLRRQHEAELARAARKRIARTEVEFCIEAMSHAFSMFRASEEWQRIGEVGRWFNAWRHAWHEIGAHYAFDQPIHYDLSSFTNSIGTSGADLTIESMLEARRRIIERAGEAYGLPAEIECRFDPNKITMPKSFIDDV